MATLALAQVTEDQFVRLLERKIPAGDKALIAKRENDLVTFGSGISADEAKVLHRRIKTPKDRLADLFQQRLSTSLRKKFSDILIKRYKIEEYSQSYAAAKDESLIYPTDESNQCIADRGVENKTAAPPKETNREKIERILCGVTEEDLDKVFASYQLQLLYEKIIRDPDRAQLACECVMSERKRRYPAQVFLPERMSFHDAKVLVEEAWILDYLHRKDFNTQGLSVLSIVEQWLKLILQRGQLMRIPNRMAAMDMVPDIVSSSILSIRINSKLNAPYQHRRFHWRTVYGSMHSKYTSDVMKAFNGEINIQSTEAYDVATTSVLNAPIVLYKFFKGMIEELAKTNPEFIAILYQKYNGLPLEYFGDYLEGVAAGIKECVKGYADIFKIDLGKLTEQLVQFSSILMKEKGGDLMYALGKDVGINLREKIKELTSMKDSAFAFECGKLAGVILTTVVMEILIDKGIGLAFKVASRTIRYTRDALKAIKEGEILSRLEAEISRLIPHPVADTGIGIPMKVTDRGTSSTEIYRKAEEGAEAFGKSEGHKKVPERTIILHDKLAATLTPEQLAAANEIIGKFPDEFRKVWVSIVKEYETDINRIQELLRAGKNEEAYELSKKVYDRTRNSFWRKITTSKDYQALRDKLEAAGMIVKKRRAPYYIIDGKEETLTLEHMFRKKDLPHLAVDEYNFSFSLKSENSDYIERIKGSDAFYQEEVKAMLQSFLAGHEVRRSFFVPTKK